MTSKDLSIFNSLRPFSIGFDDMFDQFENMLGNGGLSMQSNYPPYNIRKTGKDNYSIEVALAGFNKKDIDYTEIMIDQDPSLIAEMVEKSGRQSVPQIFIGDYHVGGFDDLVEHDMDGKLEDLLT